MGSLLLALLVLLPLRALADPAVSKEFLDPASVTAGNLQTTSGQVTDNVPAQGDVRTVRLGISQVGNAISAGQITDALPAQIQLASPVNARVSSGCGVGASFSGAPGSGTFVASNLDVPAGVNANPGRCFVYFDVVSTTVGNWINTIAIGGFTGTEAGVGAVANAQAAPRNLTVTALSQLGVAKSFSPSTVFMGGASTLTITLTNPNSGRSVDITSLGENLPSNVQATGTTPSITCSAGGTAGSVSASGTTGNTTLTFTGTRIAGAGTCTVTWAMTGVVQNGTDIGGTNTIPANSLANSRGLSSQGASAAVTVRSPVTIAKAFSPNPARAGEPVTLTVSVANRSAAAVTAVGWSDTLPGDLVITGSAASANAACQGATVTGSVGTNVLVMSGATIAAGATCTVTASVVGNTVQTYNNTSSGALWTQAGVGTATTDTTSASLDIFSSLRAFKFVNDKNGADFAFATSVAPGDPVRVHIELENFADGQITGLALTDPLPAAGGAQIVYATAATPGASNPRTNCTPNADPTQPGPVGVPTTAQSDGAASVTFTGLVVPGNPNGNAIAGARCFLEFDALVPRTWPAGTTIANTIAPANITGGTLQNGVVANTTTITQYQLFKSFAPATLSAGDTSLVTLTLVNNGFFALTGVSLDDPLPAPIVNGLTAQLRVATPANTATSCGGTPVFTISPGRDRLQVSGLTVPARASGTADSRCTVTFRVQAPIAVAYNNSATSPAATDARTNTPIPAPTPGTATLTATPSLGATKSFAPSPVSASGGIARVTITLSNIGNGQLTGVGVNDPLPASLRVASPPNAATSCAGSPTITATAGASTAALAGATLPSNTTCTFQFDVVTNSAPASVTNTIPAAGVFADGGVVTTTPVTATLATFGGGSINVQKSFSLTDLQGLGQPTRLTITIANVSTQAISGLALTDALPAGMIVTGTPNPATTCPAGLVQAVPLSSQVSISGATLPAGNGAFPAPANATCTVQVDVTLRRTGTVANAIPAGAVTTDQALTNTAQAVANVTALATVGVAKRFDPPAVAPNVPSRLVITVINSQGIDFNNLQVVDALPAGLSVASPANGSTTCGPGTVSTRPSTLGGGRTDVVMTGGALAGSANSTTCDIGINVVAATVGAYVNTIGPGGVTAALSVSNDAPADATLNVRSAVTVSKAFANFNRRVNQANRLTITLTNPNAAPLTNVTLSDNYPANVFNTTTPNAATTCGGVVAAPVSGTFVRLTAATLPANGSCTIQVDVLANEVGSWTNTIPDGALGSAEGVTNSAPASAQFVTLDPPILGKEFLPTQIASGGTSKLRIVVLNNNSATLALSSTLTDTLPTGLTLGSPALDTTTPDPQGWPRCANAATSGNNIITLATPSVLPVGGCVILANVTGTVAGEYVNSIPAGGLQTAGGPNALPAVATLAISTLNSIAGRVYRDNDNNGTFGAGDLGIAGQTVELLDAGNTVIATALTDSLGNYAFLELANGTYSVRQPNQPAGTLPGITSAPTGATTAGTATAVTTAPSQITGIVLNGAQNAQNANFGEVVPSSLAGTVFRDDNFNGTRQSAEPLLAGVTITLTGTNDLGQPVSATTTTDANGAYSFTGLRPGTYTLTEPTQPANTGNGITTAGTGATGNGTASATTTVPSTIAGIALGPDQAGSNFNFAEVLLTTISGSVYVDRNRDNVFNPADTGRIPGVTVRLVQGADCTSGTTLQTTTTDANGNFAFANVAAGGNYLLCETQPGGYGNGNAGGTPGSNTIAITNLPAIGAGGNNFGEVGGTLSGSVYLDANNDGTRQGGETGIAGVTLTLTGTDVNGNAVTRTTTTDASGNYTFADLAQGTYSIAEQTAQPVVTVAGNNVTTLDGRTTAGSLGGTATTTTTTPSTIATITLPAGGDGINNNFAELLPVSIGGTVFFDPNGNGVQNPGETGIPGQTIVVTGTNDLGQPVSRTLVTDGNGTFSVTDLRPGTYTITQPTQPPGSANGITTAGPAGGVATPVGTLPSAVGPINLTTPGASAPTNTFAELPNGGSIAGRVWTDTNNNGVIDPTEAPLANVTIELTGTDLAGNTVARTAVTDANGNYAFTGVAPGTYALREPTQPTGTVNGITVAGSTGGTPSAVATTPSTITSLVLGVNQASVNNNFGELPQGTISGFVYNDLNNNGQREATGGEGGFATQTITLTGTNDLGQPVSLTTTTGPDGSYTFAGLRPGTYTVTQPNQPANSVPGQTTAGSLGGTPSAVGTVPSTITGVVLPIGGSSTENNFGEIGDSADVVATKQAVGTFATDNVGTYRITVANIGQVATTGTYTVTDRLPAGMLLAATPTGTGWSCVGDIGATTFTCTATDAIAAGGTNANTISVRVTVLANATGGANQIVLDNAVLVEGGGEVPAYAPTPSDRNAFTSNPALLPVCAAPPAINRNLCRTPTTVLLAASVSGTVWYDTGSSTRQLDAGDRRLPGWIVEVVDTTVVGSAPVVRRVTTGSDGSWRADGLVPGREYLVRFVDPQAGIVWGLPVSGETGTAPAPCVANNTTGARSSCVESGSATQLRITLAPGDAMPQQSLPVVPGGVIYDSITRDPVPGSTVTLTPEGACPGFDPATQIANAQLGGYAISGQSISMTVGNLGLYQFLFAPTAPASCLFRLTVTPPPSHRFPSQILPPQNGSLQPPAGGGTTFAQPQPTPPAQNQPTPWFTIIGGGSTIQPIVNHHVPVDPVALIGITIVKIGSVREVELGDSLQYQVRIRNALAANRPALFIEDHLPAGFRYIAGTATVTRNGITTPIADPTGGVGPTLLFAVGPVAGNSDVILSYRVRVGVGAGQGDGINRARAQPEPGTNCKTTPAACSNESRWQVKVTLGVFTTDACIAGKIFVDCNGNHVQDKEELGIPGVRLWLQDGRSVVSDSEGKYSLCGLPPKLHVLKVDPLTLPRGSRLTTSSNRNAGDANSLFLDLKNGELHRADFIEGSCSNTVLEQVKARRTQGEVSAPQNEKRGAPALKFRGKAPTYPQQGTDSADQQPAVRPRAPGGKQDGPSENENNTPTWLLPLNQPRNQPQGGTDAK